MSWNRFRFSLAATASASARGLLTALPRALRFRASQRTGAAPCGAALALCAAAILASAPLLSACNKTEAEPESAEQYTITCTTGMITDIVRQVAGERAVVQGLMSEGVDPHLYKPTRSDIVKLQNADVVFFNGLNLEGKMSTLLVKLAREGKPVYAVTEMLDDDEYVMTDVQEHFDPHVWMDVRGWMRAVRVVGDALSQYDPSNTDYYKSNADAYLAELEKLDGYARATIASIPESQRVLITAHDAFGYFGRAYNIEVRGIQGISTESAAGVKDIVDLVNYIVEKRIPAVFVETSVADKNVRALIEGAGAKGHAVRIGGSLFSDAMGAPGTYEGTYIGMIDHNVTTIARALGGEAPEGGMQGMLSHDDQ